MEVEEKISHTNMGRVTYIFVQSEVLFSLKTGGNVLFGSLKRTDGRQNGDETPVQPLSVNFASCG